MTSFNNYQEQSRKTATFGDKSLEVKIGYCALGLVGEAGEVSEKLKKVLRGDKPLDQTIYNDEWRRELAKELGDVLWYHARLCDLIEYEMGTVATMNLEKVLDRLSRGELKGEGDNR